MERLPSTFDRPLFSRVYERAARRAEYRDRGVYRRELVAGLSGRVLELGVGPGLNFRHYPATVRRVLAVEPENRLRRIANREARLATAPVSVVPGVAEDLPMADASCDAAVVSLVLCSVADIDRAIAELRRVVRPGGELRFFEHVVSDRTWVARTQRVADHVWPGLCGGCHAGRDTLAALSAGGFDVERCRRFPLRTSSLLPTSPHVLGVARVGTDAEQAG